MGRLVTVALILVACGPVPEVVDEQTWAGDAATAVEADAGDLGSDAGAAAEDAGAPEDSGGALEDAASPYPDAYQDQLFVICRYALGYFCTETSAESDAIKIRCMESARADWEAFGDNRIEEPRCQIAIWKAFEYSLEHSYECPADELAVDWSVCLSPEVGCEDRGPDDPCEDLTVPDAGGIDTES